MKRRIELMLRVAPSHFCVHRPLEVESSAGLVGASCNPRGRIFDERAAPAQIPVPALRVSLPGPQLLCLLVWRAVVLCRVFHLCPETSSWIRAYPVQHKLDSLSRPDAPCRAAFNVGKRKVHVKCRLSAGQEAVRIRPVTIMQRYNAANMRPRYLVFICQRVLVELQRESLERGPRS